MPLAKLQLLLAFLTCKTVTTVATVAPKHKHRNEFKLFERTLDLFIYGCRKPFLPNLSIKRK